jgi:hypothetical protein
MRSEIYSQCFGEIVRPAAVDNNARGRLLARVRGTIAVDKGLYETTLDWASPT